MSNSVPAALHKSSSESNLRRDIPSPEKSKPQKLFSATIAALPTTNSTSGGLSTVVAARPRSHSVSAIAKLGDSSKPADGLSTIVAVKADEGEDEIEVLADDVSLPSKQKAVLALSSHGFQETADLDDDERDFQKAFDDFYQYLVDNCKAKANRSSVIDLDLKKGTCMVDGTMHLIVDTVPGFKEMGAIYSKNFKAKRKSYSPDFQGAVNGKRTLDRGRPSFVTPLANELLFEKFRKLFPNLMSNEVRERLNKVEQLHHDLLNQIQEQLKKLKKDALPQDPASQRKISHEIAELEAAENRLQNVDWFAIGMALSYKHSEPSRHDSLEGDRKKHADLIRNAVSKDHNDNLKWYHIGSSYKKLSPEEEDYCKDVEMLSSDRFKDGEYFAEHADSLERLLFSNMTNESFEMGCKLILPTEEIRDKILAPIKAGNNDDADG